MPSYYTNKTRVDISICHVCSRCNNPIVLNTSIDVTAITNISSDYSGRVASAHLTKLLDQIKDTQHSKESLAKLTVGVPGNVGGEVKIPDYDAPCPQCGHKEPWQKKKPTAEDYNALLPENYPQLFFNEERGDFWARMILQKQEEEIAAIRENDIRFDKLKTEYEELRCEEEELEAFLNNGIRCAPVDDLTRQIDDLGVEYKTKKLFAFREKNAITDKQSELRKRRAEIRNTLEAENVEAKRKLEENRFRQSKLEPVIKGVDNVAMVMPERRVALYRLRCKNT